MARVVLLQSGQAVPFELGSGETTLGRHPECMIQIDSNMVSRFHAKVVRSGEKYLLEDLGSGNGSFINGERLAPENPMPLKHQDRIKFGPVLFRFEQEHAGKRPVDPLSATEPEAQPIGQVAFSGDDEDDQSTIMSSVDSGSGFDFLNVRPEEKLRAVLSISRALAGVLETETLLPKILDTLFEIFPYADRGCILLQDEDGELIPRAQKHRRADVDSTVKLSRTIVNRVLQEKKAILSADASDDKRFDAAESITELSIRSIMCVPLKNVDGDAIGVINLDTLTHKPFTKDDLDLLDTVAMQAALSYDAARLLVSHTDKVKQDNEMNIARDVQAALLPANLPQPDGYELYASYDSAQAVGGDYYDVIELPGNKLALSFGDVAGKGVPGALISSRISTVVQSTLEHVREVGPAVDLINRHMCSRMAEGRFVTYVLAIIDLDAHEFSAVMAGHASPMIRKPDGTVEEFEDDLVGLPIGIAEDYPYDVVHRKLEPGEIIVIVTDGVEDAMDPDENLYTQGRIRAFLKNGPATAAELGRALLADVRKHADGHPQNDDITIMTFGRITETAPVSDQNTEVGGVTA